MVFKLGLAFYPAETAAAARKRKALEKFDTLGSSFMRFAKRLTDDPVGTRAAGREAAREEAEAKLKQEAE